MITRRRILPLLASACLTRPAMATEERRSLISAFTDAQGAHWLKGRNMEGGREIEIPLPGRGHGICDDRGGRRVVLFARRPGRFALVLDLDHPSAPHWIHARPDRHFYGHGCFSPDGRLLYATENDFDAARGVIGIYDGTQDFARVGEWVTGGIGPHELVLMPDGKTLAVANGGIETHPDYPRQKLNLPTMRSSLSLIRLHDGSLLHQAQLPDTYQQTSLRHLCAAGDGSIWLAGQHQGPATDPVEVLARFSPNGTLRPVDSAGVSAASKRYLGSIQAGLDGRIIAVTGPRGGIAAIYDAATQALLRTYRIKDVCGIAPIEDGFLFSDGLGRLWQDGQRIGAPQDGAWDNHLALISG